MLIGLIIGVVAVYVIVFFIGIKFKKIAKLIYLILGITTLLILVLGTLITIDAVKLADDFKSQDLRMIGLVDDKIVAVADMTGNESDPFEVVNQKIIQEAYALNDSQKIIGNNRRAIIFNENLIESTKFNEVQLSKDKIITALKEDPNKELGLPEEMDAQSLKTILYLSAIKRTFENKTLLIESLKKEDLKIIKESLSIKLIKIIPESTLRGVLENGNFQQIIQKE